MMARNDRDNRTASTQRGNSSIIKLKCCICGRVVEDGDSEAFSLQVRKVSAKSPEMVWAHGPCLIRAIPTIGDEIPT
jgi:hypothetical protein